MKVKWLMLSLLLMLVVLAKSVKRKEVAGQSNNNEHDNVDIVEDIVVDNSEYPSSFKSSEEFQVLPERPLQLVKPDPVEHKKLVIVEENVRHLHYLKGAVAVVAVVGKFHSGKSFLLNQLMGKPDGFGIGPTVRPQTMGIWMWGKPHVIERANGESLSVIYLDTEGFAASNISEMYDAKIFAVATILSSYLLYNSVKIIDQADIDYLDLLSRRTRLFALKSQITKAKWFDEFNHDLLQFPPLIWVVQDFVQTTDDSETPQQWLHRILSSMSRDSQDHSINLLDIFESVQCHTLFLPATKKVLLQDLSTAKEQDLTEEYREERDGLVKSIHDNLTPKEKNGRPISGPEIASLLSLLVDAANEGSLAEVPSRWDAFIEQLHTSSVIDCIMFYESEMNSLLRKYNQGAINASELELWNVECFERSKELLGKLLLGLVNATLKAQEKLKKSTEEKFEKIRDINEKKIDLRCGEAQRKTELTVEEALDEIVYPIKGDQLQSLLEDIRKKFINHYRSDVQFLSDHASFERHLKQLQNGINRIFNGAHLKNKEALEVILSASIEKAVVAFRQETTNINQIPRTTETLKGITTAAEKTAYEVFREESSMAHDEDIYNVFFGKYKSNIQDELNTVKVENMELIKTNCNFKVNELVIAFQQNTDPKRLSFPLNESYLHERLKLEREAALQAYTDTQNAFRDTLSYIEVRKHLADRVSEISDQRKEENYQAYVKEVETPLKTAKKLIVLSADNYDTYYSLLHYMEEVCLIHLDDGNAAKHWSHSLKVTIIARYINEQDDLQRLLESKTGIWSTIKGFFQYLYNLIFN